MVRVFPMAKLSLLHNQLRSVWKDASGLISSFCNISLDIHEGCTLYTTSIHKAMTKQKFIQNFSKLFMFIYLSFQEIWITNFPWAQRMPLKLDNVNSMCRTMTQHNTQSSYKTDLITQTMSILQCSIFITSFTYLHNAYAYRSYGKIHSTVVNIPLCEHSVWNT